jgi:hypothetical protein
MAIGKTRAIDILCLSIVCKKFKKKKKKKNHGKQKKDKKHKVNLICLHV